MGRQMEIARRAGRPIEPLATTEISERCKEDGTILRFELLRQGIFRISLFLFLTAAGTCASDLKTGFALGMLGFLSYWALCVFANRYKANNLNRWYEECRRAKIERERPDHDRSCDWVKITESNH